MMSYHGKFGSSGSNGLTPAYGKTVQGVQRICPNSRCFTLAKSAQNQ